MILKGKSDAIFLVLLGLLLVNTFLQAFSNDYILTINNYLAVVCLIIVTGLCFFTPGKRKRAIAVLLLLGTFNILNFTLGITHIGVSFSFMSLSPISFNLVLFILLLSFYFVNKTSVNKRIRSFLYDSESEAQEKAEKETNFYLQQFSGCNSEEFDKISKDIHLYPKEAQVAIRKLANQRQIDI